MPSNLRLVREFANTASSEPQAFGDVMPAARLRRSSGSNDAAMTHICPKAGVRGPAAPKPRKPRRPPAGFYESRRSLAPSGPDGALRPSFNPPSHQLHLAQDWRQLTRPQWQPSPWRWPPAGSYESRRPRPRRGPQTGSLTCPVAVRRPAIATLQPGPVSGQRANADEPRHPTDPM
jgi:hypothetical protein